MSIAQSVFDGNRSFSSLHASYTDTDVEIINSTFHEPDCSYSLNLFDIDLTCVNSIFWGALASPDIRFAANVQASFHACCIEGLSSVGGISENPLFEDPSRGDLRLTVDSPCVDAGDDLVDFDPFSSGFQAPPFTDLDGNARIVDGDGDGHAAIDMGAFERPGS